MATESELKTIYEDDTGIAIELDCETDLSNATSLKVMAMNESGVVTEHVATLSPGTTEKMRFTKTSSIFTTEGVYELRALVNFGTGQVQQGAIDRIYVKPSWTVST